MKLTKREKIMLIVLICVVSLYGYANFIISPQILKIKDLKSGIRNYELLMDENISPMDKLSDLDNKYEKHLRDVESYSKGFFASLEQSGLILLLDSLITDTELEVTGLDFLEYRTEELGGTELNAISATVPFKGAYESLLSFLKQIRENDKKILIKNINVLNSEEGQVSGNVVLDFYSIPPFGAKKLSDGIINKSPAIKENPFIAFEGYIDEVLNYLEDDKANIESNYGRDEGTSSSNENNVEDIKKILLEGFESLNMFFVGNPREIEGNVSMDSNKNQGSYSLKFEYDFITPRQNNIANVVFDKSKSSIHIQPEYISISVYSYEKSDHKIGFVLKDALGREYNVLLADKIDWTSWKALQAKLPEEITYPAEVQRIYVQGNNIESKTNGVFLLDNMEVAYRNILPHNYDKGSADISNGYIEYEVKKGDTIFNISKRFYNDYSKRFLIMEHNNIKDPNQIKLGQRLLIPKI